jgi:hypothetical protein
VTWVSFLGFGTSAVIPARRIRRQHEPQTRLEAITVRVPLVILGVASLVALGCGDSGGTNSSCAAAVRWNQTVYLGSSRTTAPGGLLGEGVIPACTRGDEDQRATIRRLPNVPPALAVTREEPPGTNRVYFAPGFFPVLDDHPLHRRVVRPHGCSRSFRIAGTVLRTPSTSAVPLRVSGRELSPVVVTNTEIIGFRRAGYPYLQRRDLVEVRGRRCDLPDYHRAFVADVVTPAE